MTSKERAELRAKANMLDAIFQIGKGGVSGALIAQTEDALKARELIKLKVLLETSPEKPREVADSLAEATGADVVQVVGGSIVLFKANPELHKKAKVTAKPFKKKKMYTSPKTRRPGATKPDRRGWGKLPQKSVNDTAVSTKERQADEKSAHKPLSKGRPRSTGNTGKFKAPTKRY